MTLEQLARIVMSSRSQLSRVEMAQMMAPRELPKLLDSAFKTDGLFQKLDSIARYEVHPDRYRRRMELEARAKSIEFYAGHLVPGILQTEEYARALLRVGHPKATEEELQEMVDTRMNRQAAFSGRCCPQLSVLLDEAVLRRPVGGSAVMYEQLARLVENVHTADCTVQILPYSHGEHALAGGSLNLLTLDDGSVLAYEESIASATLLEDDDSVTVRRRAYDLLRAYALSPADTAAFILEIMEGLPDEPDSRADRRGMGQVQLQQHRRRGMRRVGALVPGQRDRSGAGLQAPRGTRAAVLHRRLERIHQRNQDG